MGAPRGWHEQIFRYCERGLDPAFWAEPFNAASNLAYLAVAFVMLRRLLRLPRDLPRDLRAALSLMVLLVALIAIGSFLFHTLATRWAEIADVGPITAFMVLYTAFALRLWIGLGHGVTLGILIVFLGLSALFARIDCASVPAMAALGAAPGPCLRGSLGYAPALMALVVTGLCIGVRQAPGRALLMAAMTLCDAMMLRWLDQDMCHAAGIIGALRGTHAFWHLLTALTLAILMHAAFEAAGMPPLHAAAMHCVPLKSKPD